MNTFGTPTFGGNNTGTTSVTIPKPSDLIVGRMLVVSLRSQDGTSANAWTAPEGFVLRSSPFPTMPQSGTRVGAIFMKVITEADLNSSVTGYTFTGPSGRNVGVAIRWDPDLVGDLVSFGYSPYGGTGATNGVVTIAARTATGVGITFVLIGSELTAGIAKAPTSIPSGFTEIANGQSSLNEATTGSRTGIWLGYRVETGTSISAITGGWAGSSAVGGWSMTLGGGKAAAPSTPGLSVKLDDGTLGKLRVKLPNGTQVVPFRIRALAPGIKTHAESLLVPGCTMGHRGASAVAGMPEMGERSYDYTILRGHPLLEFSCGRTSDNVWFGLHDTTLNRTSQTTGLPAVSGMTWAQVQAYQNSLNAGGNPVQYYKLSDFLQKYTPSHTVHVDPKYGLNNMTEFLDQLDMYGGPTPEIARSRIVIKFVGTGGGAINVANTGRARGYTVAVYLYDSDVTSGAFAAEQGYWDYVGINWNSTQEIFETVKSFNKPIVVHIIPNQGAYNTAKSRIEANGWLNPALGRTWIAQTSGTDLVTPVR